MSEGREGQAGAEEAEREALQLVAASSAEARRVQSAPGPPEQPYAGLYAARALLLHARHALAGLPGWRERRELRAAGGALLLRLALVDLETEEAGSAERALRQALELLGEGEGGALVPLLTVLNQLAVLSAGRGDAGEARAGLRRALRLYRAARDEGGEAPVATDALLESAAGRTPDPAEGRLALEKAHTLTLYYLAQVCGTLGEKMTSAVYCHLTLKRQLEYDDYDPVDWALNAATLSQFFAEQNGFSQSRHHLAAASSVLRTYEKLLEAEEALDEAHDAKMEIMKHRSADVARCWAKYCLMLLSNSKNRLLMENGSSSVVTDLSNLKIESDEIEGISLDMLYFSNIDLTEFENKIGANFLLTFDDARKVFLECQAWLNKAKEYYQLNTLASDHIEIVQDNSQAYSYLSFFEDDDERQAKMHKRRINMLEEIVKEINPTYYLQYCRQLWYELGEVHSDILNIKLDKLKNTTERPTPQALSKINALSEKSIVNFGHFLDSVKDKATGCLPDKLEEDVVRPVITAYALIGRNYMKIITPNKKIQLTNYQKSFEAYKAVTDYCEKDEVAVKMMPEEMSLCQEMVNILPLKIKKLEAEVLTSS